MYQRTVEVKPQQTPIFTEGSELVPGETVLISSLEPLYHFETEDFDLKVYWNIT